MNYPRCGSVSYCRCVFVVAVQNSNNNNVCTPIRAHACWPSAYTAPLRQRRMPSVCFVAAPASEPVWHCTAATIALLIAGGC